MADGQRATGAEREQLLTSVGGSASAVTCGSCGYPVWQHRPDPVLGRSLFGNVCTTCRKAFCDECIQVGGPSPCPRCGSPTEPAGENEVRAIGVAWP